LADPKSNQAPDPREPDAWLVFEDEFSGVGAASLQNHSGDDDDADDQADERGNIEPAAVRKPLHQAVYVKK